MKMPPEPYRIKAIESISLLPRVEREDRIRQAGYNIFNLVSRDVYIDLLTDSGTSAMSDRQWAGLMMGDEAYAGCRNYEHFVEVVRSLTGYDYVIPVHQGRVAENLLFSTILEGGDYVVSNTHFDTTRANVQHKGGIAVDLLTPEADNLQSDEPFKGNMDIDALRTFLADHPQQVKACIITVTNNAAGGQPVSMANIKATREVCRAHNVPLYFDAARFAENAFFIQQRENGYANIPVRDIAREMFAQADGALMSAKKDGLANMGGFLAVRDEELSGKLTELLILIEGYRTYGGLAGRDLEAVARGLEEVTDEDYLKFRPAQVHWLGEKISELGIRVVRPIGGHAVFIDARSVFPRIPREQFPGHVLVVELYREGGIRAVEIGSLMFGAVDPETGKFIPAPYEFVRLAVPRRVYTESHLSYVVDILRKIQDKKDLTTGYKLIYESKYLRHFTARLAPMAPAEQDAVVG